MKNIRLFYLLTTIFLFFVCLSTIAFVSAAGITLPADQYQGEHKITVESYDNAGNISGSTEKTIKIDKTLPSIGTPTQYKGTTSTSIGSLMLMIILLLKFRSLIPLVELKVLNLVQPL